MFESDEMGTEGIRSAKNSLDYLNRAQCAQQQGDDSLATSLYLAAFDCARKEGIDKEDMFIDGLKQAWFLAAASKQRTLAEHIFGLMQPYLSQDEVEHYVRCLQDLAFERLEEFGVDRQGLEQVLSSIPPELAEMGFPNMDEFADEFLGVFDGVSDDGFGSEEDASSCAEDGQNGAACAGDAFDDASVAKDAPDQAATSPAPLAMRSEADGLSHAKAAKETGQTPQSASSEMPQIPDVLPFLSQMFQNGRGAIAAFGFPGVGQNMQQASDRLTYSDMAGFERAIDRMHALGIGFANDADLKEFIAFLNEKHGLDGMPVCDSLIFRSPAREDASRFMDATLGELGVPGVRVHVDENIHGDVVLCVLAQTSLGLRLNTAKGEIEGSGALLLEDIDLWCNLLPFDDDCPERSSSRSAASSNASKGVREALRLIRSAVENPDVYVLASCSADADINDAFLELLDPFTVIDIDYPTESERISLWNSLMNSHPSMRGANLDTLVACSKRLSRFDIFMAAREAIDESYKESLATRKYEPISTAMLCEKLAAYQPLDSEEYKALEEQVIGDFRRELEKLDAYLGFEDADDIAELLGEIHDDMDSSESGTE